MKKNFWRCIFFSVSMLAASSSSLSTLHSQLLASENDNSAIYSIPSLDPIEANVDNSMSTAVNRLFNAKQIKMGALTLKVYPDTSDMTKILTIQLSNLDLDLAGLPALDINFYASARILYEGIDETLDVEFESQGSLFVTHRSKSFKFSIPHTLDDLFEMLQALGIFTKSNDNSGDVSLVELLEELKTAATTVEQNNTENNGFIYSLSADDFTMNESEISNISLLLLADSNNIPTGIKTKDMLTISKKDSTSGIGITLDGSFTSINNVSTYSKRGSSSIIDVTDSNKSLLGTITKIFTGGYTSNVNSEGEKLNQVNINISGSLTNQVDASTAYTSSIDGVLQADVTDVFEDENYGTYALSLTHKNDATTFNDIDIYYDKNKTYFSLNELFKGRIDNSKLKDVFSHVSDITSIPSYKEIDEDLNFVFNVATENSLTKLMDGDYSAFYDIFTSYTYSDTSFELVLDPTGLGLDGDSLTLEVNFDQNNKLIKDITLEGLVIGDITLNNLTLSLDDYSDITIPNDAEYSNYSESMTVFDSLSTILDEKKVNADYTLIYTDQSGVTYNADGNISADLSNAQIDTTEEIKTFHTDSGTYHLSFNLPKENNANNSALGQGIEAYYDGNSKNLFFGYQYYQSNDYDLTKDGPHYVFKNSLPFSDITDMYHYIDTKVENDETTESNSSSLTSMFGFIDAISNSSKLESIKNSIKNNLALNSLDGVISTSVDTDNNIVVTIDSSSFLVDTSYASNTTAITLTLGSDGSVIDLSVSGKINGATIHFSLDLDTNVSSYSYFNTTDYPAISHGQELLESFVSLPTDLEEFDIGLSGYVNKDDKNFISISSGTGASVNTTGDLDTASGVLLVRHPDINDSSKMIDFDQKLEFNYQQADGTVIDTKGKSHDKGEFLLEYNDNMHVKMDNQDLFDIMGILEGVDSEDNLLYRYLKFMNSTVESSGSPLMDLIEGKALSASGIFDYPYFNSIAFNDGSITINVDPKLIQSDAGDGSTALITMHYDIDSKHITSADIQAKYITADNTFDINASVTLQPGSSQAYQRTTDTSKSDQSNYITEYTSSNASNFVNVNGFKVLLDCLVDTTENNFMEIEGTLCLSLSIAGDLYVGCYAAIYVEDETAYAYLRFRVSEETSFPGISEDGYRVTEFFIKESEVLVNQTRASTQKKLFQSKKYIREYIAYKTTADNIMANIPYYLLDFVMDLGRIKVLGIGVGTIALNQIYDAVNSEEDSDVVLNNDFSEVLSEFAYSNNTFDIKVDLSKLILEIPVISFEDTEIKIHHKSEDSNGYKPLSSVEIVVTLKLLSILNIGIKQKSGYNTFSFSKLLHITGSQAQSTYMSRYYTYRSNFFATYGNYDDNSTLGMYNISKVTKKGSPTVDQAYDDNHNKVNSSVSNSYTSTSSSTSPFANDWRIYIW